MQHFISWLMSKFYRFVSFNGVFIDLVICPNKDKQTSGLFVCVYGTYTAPWENVMVSKRGKKSIITESFLF